jgi:site-specific DNA-methyltransferase (adenine-specific)
MQAAERGETHTPADLIEELTGTRDGNSSIRDTLHIAKYLDIPEVAKAKTQKEATQIVKRKLEKEHRQKLAEGVKEKKTPHTISLGDSTQQLLELPSDAFDLLLTDPPYGVGADTFGEQAGVAHNYADTPETSMKLYETLAREGYRVCKSEAHVYVFCDFVFFSQISLTFALEGWNVWPRPLIWSKRNGMLPRPAHGPRYTYEVILFASKGDREVLCVKPDVLDYGQVQNQIHAAEKPVDLLRDLIARSCRPGDSVLDPFAGSGSTLEAAFLEGCIATLIELNPDNYNMCLERLSNLELEI